MIDVCNRLMRAPILSPITRRSALRGFGSTALALASCPAFGQMRAHKPLRVGLELYTVDNAMRGDFDNTLRRVASLGYKTVEFPWFYGHAAGAVRKSLTRAGLTCKSALFYPNKRVGRNDKNLEDDLPALLDFSGELGLKYMGSVVFPLRADFDPSRATSDDYKFTAEFLNKIGLAAGRVGIQFTYHNHDFEFFDLGGGETGFDILMRSTEPSLVKSALDVGWVVHAGRDPIHYLQKYGGRYATLHLRDLTAETAPKPMKMNAVSLGSGIIDWKPLLKAAAAAGAEFGYVEHDPKDPTASLEMARASLAYLSRLPS